MGRALRSETEPHQKKFRGGRVGEIFSRVDRSLRIVNDHRKVGAEFERQKAVPGAPLFELCSELRVTARRVHAKEVSTLGYIQLTLIVLSEINCLEGTGVPWSRLQSMCGGTSTCDIPARVK